nr:isoform gamma-4 of serine/threonine-protein phosphatase 2a 56 kda regulatory subunit gamma isoform [Quercus suber]
MVYNAMKLFMEVNPQLFDECSHEYTETQNNADAVKADRKAKWDRLSALAESMRQQNGHAPAVRPPGSDDYGKSGQSVTSPLRADDSDPLSQESQQRMERLRLQDDRRPQDYDRPSNSVR